MSDSTSQGDHPAFPPQTPPYAPPQQSPVPPQPAAPQSPAAPQHPSQPQYPVQPYSGAPSAYPAQQHPVQQYQAAQQHPVQQYQAAPQYQGAQPYAPARPTSGLAITSLITGIAGIVFSWTFVLLLASVAAVITGHIALKQTRQNPTLAGRGMAIAGLILGYAGVAVILLSIIIGIVSAVFFGTLPFLLYGIYS